MRSLLLGFLTLCAVLGACGKQGAPVTAPWQNQQLEMRASVVTNPLEATLKLYINETRVIDDITLPFAGSSQNFSGFWQGQRVLARMSRDQIFFTIATRIDVFINGNLVETLRL